MRPPAHHRTGPRARRADTGPVGVERARERPAPPVAAAVSRALVTPLVLVISLVVSSLAPVALLTGCSTADGPVVAEREMLDTVVTMTAYGEDTDRDAIETACVEAFDAMEETASLLDAYDPDSELSAINADPDTGTPLPCDAMAIEEAIDALGVREYFDPELGGVSDLWDFGGTGHVPDEEDLVTGTGAVPTTGSASPRLDYSGALKGLALQRAASVLDASPVVTGALVTAGSTTVAVGSKPDGAPWRVGIEDPRAVGSVIAVLSATEGPLAVSTSGDYQRYFVRDGTRYHHILDPATGRPARGVRSVTVATDRDESGALAADILSTALFVMGPEDALDYAERHGLVVYLIDDEGRVHTAPGPEDGSIELEERSRPTR